MLTIQADGSIRLTRGDTARLTINITNDTTGGNYEIGNADVLELSVKKSVNDAEPCLHKSTTGTNTIHIKPEDTKNLAFGKYKYDVQLTTESGDVFTVIEPTVFELSQEVTY